MSYLFLRIGTSLQIKKISVDGVIRVGISNVKPADSARNLGVYFDTNLNIETQLTNICNQHIIFYTI